MNSTVDESITCAAPLTVIPVIEEQLEISKRVVETGVVRITKHVDERRQIIDEPLTRDDVEVVRVRVDRVVDQPVAVRTEGDLTIISVHEEVTLVTKQLVVTEEIHIRKKTSEFRLPIDVGLRRESISIEETSSDARLDSKSASDRQLDAQR